MADFFCDDNPGSRGTPARLNEKKAAPARQACKNYNNSSACRVADDGSFVTDLGADVPPTGCFMHGGGVLPTGYTFTPSHLDGSCPETKRNLHADLASSLREFISYPPKTLYSVGDSDISFASDHSTLHEDPNKRERALILHQ